MNTLSWLIYLADVAGGLSVVVGIGFFLSSIAIIAFGATGFFQREENRSYGPDDKDFVQGSARFNAAIGRLWIPIAFAVPLVLVPSKDTVYAIAISEMGEEVLNTETGGKAVQALNAWLDRQIEGEKDGE